MRRPGDLPPGRPLRKSGRQGRERLHDQEIHPPPRAAATGTETLRVRSIWEREAPHYDRVMGWFERVLFSGDREWVCSQASGAVLEVAIGTGRNLPFYEEGIRLTGSDLSPAMLSLARSRARELRIQADLLVADAQALPYAEGSFDSVVCTLSLCSIPDHLAAIGEIRRVLRPGGRLLLVEHVRSSKRAVRLGQRALEPLTVRLEGDHLTRDPLDHLEASGFTVESCMRLKWGIVERVVAIKPDPGPGGTAG